MKHNGLRTIEQYSIFDVKLHRPSQHTALYVTPFSSQRLWCVSMAYALGLLRNDRTFIEVRGYVVSRRANHFDPTIERLSIGFCSLEAWQK